MLKMPTFKDEDKHTAGEKGGAASPTGQTEITVYNHRGRATYGYNRQAPVSKASAADKAALQQALQDKFIKHHVGMPTEEELIDGNNYVVGKDGLYLVRKNSIGLFVTKADNVPFIDRNPVEGFHMSLDNKLPYNYLLQTISFFKKVVKEKSNAEAMIQVLLNSDGEYFMHIADQEVAGASVKFKRDEDLEKENTLILDIHSHNTMSAFFSGTDNADEKEARVYGVIGHLNKDWPDMKFRAGDGTGSWITLEIHDVFETPDAVVEFPEEWMEKVHKPGSGIFGEHSRPKYTPPSRPYNPYYDRRTFPGDRWNRQPWNTGDFPRVRSFGPVGSPEQDILGEYDWERWEKEAEEGDLAFEQNVIALEEELAWQDKEGAEVADVASSIRGIINSADTLSGDEARAMWLSFADKLDPISREELLTVLRELA